MPLPAPYRYSATDFLAVPDSESALGFQYMKRPIDSRSNQLVSEERANELLHDYQLYDELLPELPQSLGIRDEKGRMQTDWNTVLRQENGNIVQIPIVTGGYAMVKFPRAQNPAGYAVIESDLLPLLLGGTLGIEQIRFMAMPDATLASIKAWTPAQWQQFKALGLAQGVLCDCTETDDDGAPVVDTYTVIELYQLTTETTTPTDPTTPTPTPKPTVDPIVRVDYNDCSGVGGWAANPNNTAAPQPIDLYVNGQFEAKLTPSVARPDVAKYLRDLGYTAVDTSLFQWNYTYPAKYRMGAPISIQVFASGTRIEAGYNAAQTTGVCGVPPTNPNPPAAYVVQQRIDGTPSLTAGQTKRYWTTDRYSDDTEKRRTDSATYSIDGGTPFGLTLTPQGAEVDITYAGSETGRSITLVGTYPGGGRAVLSIQLVGTGCMRPTGLAYKPQLVYNAVPANGGNARLFTSLEDANTTLGKHFDGTAQLNLSGSIFPAEMANYNVGTDVYYRWSPDYTSCERASDNIYYVLNGDATNGQKIAIQVVNGKIAAVLVSTYVTPTAPTPGTPSSPSTQEGIWGGKGTPTTYYIKSIQTRSQPKGDYIGNNAGILLRVKAVGKSPFFAFSKQQFTGTVPGTPIPEFTIDDYNYTTVVDDRPAVGAEYITVGPLDDSGRYINIKVPDKSVTETAYTTHYTQS